MLGALQVREQKRNGVRHLMVNQRPPASVQRISTAIGGLEAPPTCGYSKAQVGGRRLLVGAGAGRSYSMPDRDAAHYPSSTYIALFTDTVLRTPGTVK